MKNKHPLKKDFIQLLQNLLVAILIYIFTFVFLFGIHVVTDDAMSPNLREGDLIIFFKPDKQFRSNDLLVLKREDAFQVRRVVAREGDIVNLSSSGLQINGSSLSETSLEEEVFPYIDGITYPYQIPEDSVFLLGDNRTLAQDSRLYGYVTNEECLGKVILIIRRRNL